MKKVIRFFGLLFLLCFPTAYAAVWTIAIDPGHGGKDPGAISHNQKLQEKHVTLSIAKELKALLDRDPRFRAVLTRKGDYYISVPKRSEIARKYKANYLISIHADSSVSSALRGASVWVLSNRRANDEMGQWLEDNEKRSELLGGAGSVLASHKERYLDQTVLDLQFGHSQRVGYELGDIVLRHFAKIAALSRSVPQHASLGVLRSPDIPSILVETGFLSNNDEEKLLASPAYRKKIAQIIYDGLVEYRTQHNPVEDKHKGKNALAAQGEKNLEKTTALAPKNGEESAPSAEIKDSGLRHKVRKGENLTKLAAQYQVNPQDLLSLNKLKRKQLLVGETLKIPDNGKNTASEQESLAATKNAKTPDGKEGSKHSGASAVKKSEKSTAPSKQNAAPSKDNESKTMPKFHTVGKNQTLYSIARDYDIPVNKLLKLNPKLKDGKVLTGQKIRLQE